MAGDPRPRPRIAAVGGLTPQAMNLTPLRGFLPFIRWRGTAVQASRLHILTRPIFSTAKNFHKGISKSLCAVFAFFALLAVQSNVPTF